MTSLIVHVPEYDGFGGTSLLASRSDIRHILQGTVFLLRLQLSLLQSLYAERTFFHHPAATDGDVRVQHHAGQVIVHLEDRRIQLTYRGLILIVREAVRAAVIGPVET